MKRSESIPQVIYDLKDDLNKGKLTRRESIRLACMTGTINWGPIFGSWNLNILRIHVFCQNCRYTKILSTWGRATVLTFMEKLASYRCFRGLYCPFWGQNRHYRIFHVPWARNLQTLHKYACPKLWNSIPLLFFLQIARCLSPAI